MPEAPPETEVQETHRRGFLRRALKVALVMLGVLVGLVVLALVGARAYLTEDRVRDLAVRQLDEALQGDFAVGDLDWISFPTRIALKDVTVTAPDGETVLTAERLVASIEVLALLSQRVRVTDVRVKGLHARLVPPEDPEAASAFTLVQAFRPQPKPEEPPSESPWTVRVTGVQATDLALELRTAGGTEVAARELTLEDGGFRLDGPVIEVTGDARAGAVRVAAGERVFEAGPVTADGLTYLSDEDQGLARLTVEDARFEGEGFSGRLEGRLTDLTGEAPIGFKAEGEATVAVDAPLVRSFVPEDTFAKVAPAGQVRLDLSGQGTLEAPELTITATGEDLQTALGPVTRLKLQGAWETGEVRVDTLELELPEGGLTASGRFGLTGADVGYALKARLDALPVRRLAAPFADPEVLPARIAGTLEAEGSALAGPEGRVQLDLTVSGLPAVVPRGVPEPLSVKGTVRLAGGRARLSPLVVSGRGAVVRLRGTAPLEATGALDLQVGADLTRPNPLLRGFDLPVQAREAHLTAQVAGSVKNPAVEGTFTAARVRYEDLPAADVSVPFRFADGTLHLDRASVQVAGGRALASGRIELMARGELLDRPRADLRVGIAGVRIGPFTEEAVQGRVFFQGRVTGPLDAPVGRGSLRVRELKVREVPFSEARAELTADGTEVRLEDLTLTPQAGGALRGSGTVNLKTRELQADLTGTEVPLSLVDEAVEAEVPVTGQANLTLKAAGPLQAPELTVELELSDVVAREVPVGEVTAKVTGTPDDLDFDVQTASPAGPLGLKGRFGAEGRTVDLRLDTEGVALSKLPWLADTGLDGTLAIDVTVQGTLPVPRVEGTLRLSDLTYEEGRIGTGEGLVRIEHLGEGRHRVDAEIAGALDLQADVSAGPPLQVDLQGAIDEASLAWFSPALQESEIDGIVGGDVRVRYRQEPAELTAEVKLKRFDLMLGEEVLRNRGPVTVAYEDGLLRVQGVDLAGPRGTLQVAGTIGDRLDVTAKGTLEMEVVAPLVSGIARSTGTIELDLKVAGTPEAPRLDGDARIVRTVRIRPRRMIREVEVTSGHVVFSPGKVQLRSLNGEMQGGAFRASGELTLDGLTPKRYDLRLSGQNLPLRTADLSIEANADLEVTGEAQNALISGRVDIVRGRYRRKFELDKFVFRAADVEVDEPLARKYPWLSNLRLDLRATSTGGMEVDVNAGAFALSMGLDADLRVTGTAGDPVVDGRVAASRGQIEFPRAELEVVRAIIEFTPNLGTGIEPQIDLRAEGEVTPPYTGEGVQIAYFVTLTLEGTLDEMELDLVSDPALDRLEVLSLLVTGQVNPLTGQPGRGGAAGAAMVFAGSQLAEPLTRFVTKGLEDLLNLELQLGAQVSATGLTVTAGKEVTRRLRLEGAYEQAFGEDVTIATARARYLISDRLFLEGVAEQVTGQSTAVNMPREGSRTRLELKYRIFGD